MKHERAGRKRVMMVGKLGDLASFVEVFFFPVGTKIAIIKSRSTPIL
jgi:uncharacterized DUF497 family protein